jgi:hypothetical protein
MINLSWKKKRITGGVETVPDLKAVESLVYGIVSGMVTEKLREIIELQSAQRSEFMVKVKDIDRQIEQVAKMVVDTAKTEVIGKAEVLEPVKLAEYKQMTEDELRKRIRKCAGKIRGRRGGRSNIGYTLIYDKSAPIVGFHPYDIGREAIAKRSTSYLNTVAKRGKLPEIAMIAEDLANK